jgi:hypothetical protein
MLHCLDIILSSFHCILREESSSLAFPSVKMPTTISKLALPVYFRYYLGEGNNHNLVRSILKKRGWWMETNSVHKAQLVWTQNRKGNILQQS